MLRCGLPKVGGMTRQLAPSGHRTLEGRCIADPILHRSCGMKQSCMHPAGARLQSNVLECTLQTAADETPCPILGTRPPNLSAQSRETGSVILLGYKMQFFSVAFGEAAQQALRGARPARQSPCCHAFNFLVMCCHRFMGRNTLERVKGRRRAKPAATAPGRCTRPAQHPALHNGSGRGSGPAPPSPTG